MKGTETTGLSAWIRLRSSELSGKASSLWTKLAVLSLVGVLAWTSLLPTTKTTPVFGDEIGWISVSSYTADLVRSGKFDQSFWDADSFGAWGPMNPPVGKLALGLPLRVGHSEPPFRRTWDWSLDAEANLALGNLPSPDLLLTARRIAATHAALLVVVVCALGWEVGGPFLGLLAAGLLTLLPTWRETGSMVLTDMLVCSVLLSMAIPATRLLRRTDTDRGLGPMALLGLLLGVAGAIKPTGFVLGGMFIASLLVYRAFRSRSIRPHLAGAVAAAALAGANIVALDPWLWPDPRLANPEAILREVPVALAALGTPDPLGSLKAKRAQLAGIAALGRPAFLVVRAQRWKDLVARQRGLPELQWKSPRLQVLLEWITFRFVGFPGAILFALVGIWGTFRPLGQKTSAGGSRGRPSVVPALFTAVAAVYALLLVVLPVPRYILPLLCLLQLLAAQGILHCLAWTRSHRRWGRPIFPRNARAVPLSRT